MIVKREVKFCWTYIDQHTAVLKARWHLGPKDHERCE